MNDPIAGAAVLDAPERFSPLDAQHRALGASFTSFGGWQMPIRYSSDLAEHHAVRQDAGLFDISHMGVLSVRGAGAGAFLDRVVSARVSALAEGQAKYALLLTEAGGVVDDLIVYRLAGDRYLIVANAGNRQAVAGVIGALGASVPDVAFDDISDEHALLALQGPRSREALAATAGVDAGDLGSLGYYRAREGSFTADGAEHRLLVARTGYTGEDGFELILAASAGAALWRALLAAGEAFGVVPCGLAARDSLRLEAGMPLYGHELGLETHPGQLPLGRAVTLDEGRAFRGRGAVEAGVPSSSRVLVGLAGEGRRAARAGYAVVSARPVRPDQASAQDASSRTASGETVGIVTSGVLSPTLGHPIAMAFVDRALAEPGTRLAVDVRGTPIPFTVTTLPFYTRPTSTGGTR